MGCPNLDTVHDNETSYMDSIGTAMSLHTRYPGHDGHTGPPGSQLARTLSLIDNVFTKCRARTCIHQQAQPLLDYLWYDDSVVHHRHGKGSQEVPPT